MKTIIYRKAYLGGVNGDATAGGQTSLGVVLGVCVSFCSLPREGGGRNTPHKALHGAASSHRCPGSPQLAPQGVDRRLWRQQLTGS